MATRGIADGIRIGRPNYVINLGITKVTGTVRSNSKIGTSQARIPKVAGDDCSIGKVSLMQVCTAKVAAEKNRVAEVRKGQLRIAEVVQDELLVTKVIACHLSRPSRHHRFDYMAIFLFFCRSDALKISMVNSID